MELFPLHVEQDSLLCFVPKAKLVFGASLLCAPTKNRLLGNKLTTWRDPNELVNLPLEGTEFASFFKISLILYNLLSAVSLAKVEGKPYGLEFFLEGGCCIEYPLQQVQGMAEICDVLYAQT